MVLVLDQLTRCRPCKRSPRASAATTRTRCRWRKAQEFIAHLVQPVEAVEKVADPQQPRPRAGARRRLADRRAGARQLGDGRLRAARQRSRGRRADTAARSPAPGSPGQQFAGAVPPGACVRIMTGAVMPAGLDTVVPQEFVTVDGDAGHRSGRRRAHRRQPPPGRRGPGARRGRAARRPQSCGRPTSACSRRSAMPRCRCAAACASRSFRPATNCARSASRSTKAASTTAIATRCTACCSGWASSCSISASCATSRPRSRRRFAQAAESADAVITSGGVSVGEADYTKKIMAELGDVLFWRIAMRPGRPMAIGRIGHDGGTARSCSACPATRSR